MRIGKLTISGVERPLCFSTRVVCDAQTRFGGLDGLMAAMGSDSLQTKLDAVTWTLARMLDAGARYVNLTQEGAAPPQPPTQEDLLDLYGPDDLVELVRAINTTMSAGAEREVDLEPPKNAEATDGA